MALYDRLRDALRDPDAVVRLDAARRAADSGDHRLVGPLLEVALRDRAEVRMPGGLGESIEHVGDAAAVALGEILGRRGGIDPRVASEVTDLEHDDDRVATLLYYLGQRYEPLRQRLESHPEPRVRLRAARAVLSIHRTAAFATRLLADPAPLLRLEGLQVPASVRDDRVCLHLMIADPAPEVRAEAALLLRFTATGIEPFAEAARRETDPGVRAALVACLAHRRRDPAAVRAIIGLLGDRVAAVRRAAAEALRDTADPATAPLAGAAIALRVLAEPDESVLAELLRFRPLLQEAPELRPLIERLHRYANFDGDRHALGALLSVPPRAARAASYDGSFTDGRGGFGDSPGAFGDSRGGLGDNQGVRGGFGDSRGGLGDDQGAFADGRILRDDRFLREVARQAADAAVAPDREAADMTEMAEAVASHDAERVMTAGEMVAYRVALDDLQHRAADPVRGPTTAARRALLLTRAAHALAARLLAAGVEPPGAAPILRLLLPGENPVEALRSVMSVDECRRARNVTWLRLLMRPADEEWYLEALRAASPKTPPSEVDDVSDWHLELAVAAAEGRRTGGYR
ncbi:HEAT repeat domain-containing protein [Dactylosporangium darangshiense]|uniref:HEAT repeat domain-containing protein n=1 Tax=Dactylosporangium darangshiense TaxID=579108 RepID=A0ABP8DKQ8_9ACTN